MEDKDIVDLYWQRDEKAISETAEKYGRYCYSIAYMRDESIEMFVRTRIGWIKRQREEFDAQPRQTKREYVSGEAFYRRKFSSLSM